MGKKLLQCKLVLGGPTETATEASIIKKPGFGGVAGKDINLAEGDEAA